MSNITDFNTTNYNENFSLENLDYNNEQQNKQTLPVTIIKEIGEQLQNPNLPSPIKRNIQTLKRLRNELRDLEHKVKEDLSQRFSSVDERVDQLLNKLLESPKKKAKVETVQVNHPEYLSEEEPQTPDEFQIIYRNPRQEAAKQRLIERLERIQNEKVTSNLSLSVSGSQDEESVLASNQTKPNNNEQLFVQDHQLQFSAEGSANNHSEEQFDPIDYQLPNVASGNDHSQENVEHYELQSANLAAAVQLPSEASENSQSQKSERDCLSVPTREINHDIQESPGASDSRFNVSLIDQEGTAPATWGGRQENPSSYDAQPSTN